MKNILDQYPGPVTPSAADGAPLVTPFIRHWRFILAHHQACLSIEVVMIFSSHVLNALVVNFSSSGWFVLVFAYYAA